MQKVRRLDDNGHDTRVVAKQEASIGYEYCQTDVVEEAHVGGWTSTSNEGVRECNNGLQEAAHEVLSKADKEVTSLGTLILHVTPHHRRSEPEQRS